MVANLPVGDNLQDHVMVYPFDYLIDKPLAITIARAESFPEVIKYQLFGKGNFENNFESILFYKFVVFIIIST